MMTVRLIAHTPEPEKVVAAAAKLCYSDSRIALMFICAWRHIPAIPTLFINILVTVIMIFFQKPGTSLQSLAKLISDGFVAHTSDATVNTLGLAT